jgi:lactate permease
LIGLQWSAKKNNADNFSSYCDACYFIWGMTLTRVSSSIIQGLVITVSVWWIVFGVIFFIE